MTSRVVSAHLDALVTSPANTPPNPVICTRSPLGPAGWKPGWDGGSSGYVKIATTTPASPAPSARWAVLLTGGVHARELAPPDALVSFLEKLVPAYAAKRDIVYPAWTDPASGIVYDSFLIPWPWVRNVVEKLDLYVVPLVNDDGRDFALANPTLIPGWRKNRRPAPTNPAPTPIPSDPTGKYCKGVDINRNFDILWDFEKHYTSTAGVQATKKPCDPEVYIGKDAESEPETMNVANLMRSKNISFFIDFHMYGQGIMYSWGIETNQDQKADMNFGNSAFDHLRDGNQLNAYGEYIPTATAAEVNRMAWSISNDILGMTGTSNPNPMARIRSIYTPIQSAKTAITSGASDDYCFSRWMAANVASPIAPISPVRAFTIEVGGDPNPMPRNGHAQVPLDEGGFSPHYVEQYPKLEREIHVAAWSFLKMAAGMPFQGPTKPTLPP
jgi:hypothetical protein